MRRSASWGGNSRPRKSKPSTPFAPRPSDCNSKPCLEPGEASFLNNYTVMHARSQFDDWEEPDKKRLMLRLWLDVERKRRPVVRFAALKSDGLLCAYGYLGRRPGATPNGDHVDVDRTPLSLEVVTRRQACLLLFDQPDEGATSRLVPEGPRAALWTVGKRRHPAAHCRLGLLRQGRRGTPPHRGGRSRRQACPVPGPAPIDGL